MRLHFERYRVQVPPFLIACCLVHVASAFLRKKHTEYYTHFLKWKIPCPWIAKALLKRYQSSKHFNNLKFHENPPVWMVVIFRSLFYFRRRCLTGRSHSNPESFPLFSGSPLVVIIFLPLSFFFPLQFHCVSDSLCHPAINWLILPTDAVHHMANISVKWKQQTPPAPSGKWHFGNGMCNR